MMNVAIIASLRPLPTMAEEGLALVFFFLLAALLFLIPTALVSAELATGWPRQGGVYVWVKEAFGEKIGFLAVWLQWIQSIVLYPATLAFSVAALAYLINPAFAANKIYMIIMILVIFWGVTFANFKGIKTSGLISTIGAIGGTIIPGAFIILLGILWLAKGNPTQISLSLKGLVPDMTNLRNIVFLAGALLAYAGMEVTAAHANDVKNPQKNYPRAIFLSAVIVVVIFVLGALSTAIVVPQKHLSLVAGVMEAFRVFFNQFGLLWLLPVLGVLVFASGVSQVNAWIVGPSKGLLTTAQDGNLPKFFQKTNKNGVPVNVLILQALIVTVFSAVFVLMPTVSASFWILIALTIQLYLIMYCLLYASAIKLRYTKPNVKRAYRIPFGNFGMWCVAGIGFIAAILAILLGFLPPAQLKTGNIVFYLAFLLIGILILVITPLLIHHFKKKSWIIKR